MTDIQPARYWTGVAFSIVAAIVSFFIPGDYNAGGIFLLLAAPAIANLIWFDTAPRSIFFATAELSVALVRCGNEWIQESGLLQVIGIFAFFFGLAVAACGLVFSVILFCVLSLFFFIPQLVLGFFAVRG